MIRERTTMKSKPCQCHHESHYRLNPIHTPLSLFTTLFAVNTARGIIRVCRYCKDNHRDNPLHTTKEDQQQ